MIQRKSIPILFILGPLLVGCAREPMLHLHGAESNCQMDVPVINIDLGVYWDYKDAYGEDYDWEKEWFYGWDKQDEELFGTLGYSTPDIFHLRFYYAGDAPGGPHQSVKRYTISGTHMQDAFGWGFWDVLAWNEIETLDGVQSLNFDEGSTLEKVTAYTNPTMKPTRYNPTKSAYSYYEPEQLFSGYYEDLEVSRSMKGFEYDPVGDLYYKTLELTLEPVTYIYLTQVILHHNEGRITNVDGSANFSGMAQSVTLNTGIAGSDAITVNYNVRFKRDRNMRGESVDIAGGRLLTFGMCNVNANRLTRAEEMEGDGRHYLDLPMQFNNGCDTTIVFDITDQVRRRFKGGVITVELDVDTIPIPTRGGGSGFDAVVKDYENGGTYEIEM